jgi:hypothetical protein
VEDSEEDSKEEEGNKDMQTEDEAYNRYNDGEEYRYYDDYRRERQRYWNRPIEVPTRQVIIGEDKS